MGVNHADVLLPLFSALIALHDFFTFTVVKSSPIIDDLAFYRSAAFLRQWRRQPQYSANSLRLPDNLHPLSLPVVPTENANGMTVVIEISPSHQ